MKKILTVGLGIAFLFATLSANSQNFATNEVKSVDMTKQQKQSYAIGVNMGKNVARDGIMLDMESFIKGVKDGIADQNKFTDEEMNAIFSELQKDLQAIHEDKIRAEKEKGRKFLEENKKNKSIYTTESGLQYKIITRGTGPKPTADSKVTVNYEGRLLDGTVFDSSIKQGKPITFGLNRVIRGWTEGVQLMPVGSKFIFYIPSDLAYGDRGAGNDIPGGATLIFEIELLSIDKVDE